MKTNIFESMSEYEAARREYEARHDGNSRALYNNLDVVIDGKTVRTDCTIRGYKRMTTAVKHFWVAIEAAGFTGGWCFADIQSCINETHTVGGSYYRDGVYQVDVSQIDDATYYIAYNYDIETLDIIDFESMTAQEETDAGFMCMNTIDRVAQDNNTERCFARVAGHDICGAVLSVLTALQLDNVSIVVVLAHLRNALADFPNDRDIWCCDMDMQGCSVWVHYDDAETNIAMTAKVNKPDVVDLSAKTVNNTCVKYDWCTGMDNEQYHDMLQRVDHDNQRGGFGPVMLATLAGNIKCASETDLSIEHIAHILRKAAATADILPEQTGETSAKSHRVDLTAEKLDALCQKYNWCDDMNSGEYRLLLENVDRDNKRGFGRARLATLARQIKWVTDTEITDSEIANILYYAGIGEAEQNLRTNSAQAVLNIREYVVNHADFENYDGCDLEFKGNPKSFADVAAWIYQIFCNEMPCANRPGATSEQRFEDWCSGLPSALDYCYWYNRSAVDDLGNILQQTSEKKAKYTEGQAEKELTRLIYREIIKEVR